MKSFVIGKNDSGQRLDKFISKAVPSLPQSLMYKYIRTKRIKVNSKRAEISLRLEENDTVDMYINDEFFAPVAEKYDFLSASKKLSVIYEDSNIMLLDKSVGLLSHPDENEYNDTLISRVRRYLYEKGEYDPSDENSFSPSLVNRIDRNTGGIVIAAKNAESLCILNLKLKNREIDKYYLCVVHGILKKKSGILEGYMSKDETKNKVTVSSREIPGGKIMRTEYSVIDEKDGLSLVRVKLLTGRTHQIRAQFAAAGHPLLGDGKYGTNAMNKKYGYKKQFLYSYRLVFSFTEDAGILNYLNGKEFEVPDVWFYREFIDGKLTPGEK
ncbi:MAG: RluA family pseudouridine synthase [Clostridia bacterium]|nr:RluA family pseudouridine synthase [Clostridia bacterium]